MTFRDSEKIIKTGSDKGVLYISNNVCYPSSEMKKRAIDIITELFPGE